MASCVRVEAEVLLGRDNTDGVGVAHAAPPALDAHDWVTLVKDTELDGVVDAPLEAAVDVLLPRSVLEVWLLLVEEEGINATVKVGILWEC